MPASSRKRNKGKDRKAKQLAKKEENERAFAHEIWQSVYSSTECDHGCGMVTPADDHPVSNFMDQFIINAHHKGMTVLQNLKDTLETHTHIWNNESHRKLIIDIMVCMGTNMLLHGDVNMSWVTCLVQSLIVLEKYNGTNDLDSVIHSRVVMLKWRQLYIGTKCVERDVLKFYRKRTTCKCLKNMHLEARKAIPKMGFCWGCDKDMERVLLSLCSRCMISQYCSRRCQVADWSKHESVCDQFVRQQKMNDEQTFG